MLEKVQVTDCNRDRKVYFENINESISSQKTWQFIGKINDLTKTKSPQNNFSKHWQQNICIRTSLGEYKNLITETFWGRGSHSIASGS